MDDLLLMTVTIIFQPTNHDILIHQIYYQILKKNNMN